MQASDLIRAQTNNAHIIHLKNEGGQYVSIAYDLEESIQQVIAGSSPEGEPAWLFVIF